MRNVPTPLPGGTSRRRLRKPKPDNKGAEAPFQGVRPYPVDRHIASRKMLGLCSSVHLTQRAYLQAFFNRILKRILRGELMQLHEAVMR